MLLRRIEILEFRKIAHRLVDGLGEGLNIVVGDNEAGKSTMLAALRAVFFERHRVGGAVADAMQPYGGSLRPTVRVDFELDGRPWSLAKSFCQRPEASLVGPGERLSGDAVEDRLAELLGFTPPGRGGSKPDEHQGTHGLLWVEQGTHSGLGVGAGRDTLAAALEGEVGQVTGGERGRALVAAAERRRDRFWDKRDKPRGEVLAQRKLVDELLREEQDLAERRAASEAKIARLAAVGDILGRHRRDDRLAKAVAAVTTARRAVAEADQRVAALAAATAARIEAERQRAEAAERRDQRASLLAKLEASRSEAARLARDLEEADAVARRARLTARDADDRFDAARRTRERAEDRLRMLEEARARREAETASQAREAMLLTAESQAAERRRALVRVEATSIDAPSLKALVALDRAADQSASELAAASVELVFEVDGERGLTIDGADHPTGAPLRLARDAALVLEGFGRVLVRPGGGTAILAQQADAAARARSDALAAHGVATVEEARRLLQDRTEAQAIVASLTQSLSALAPDGLEALRQAIENDRARRARPVSIDMPDGPVGASVVEEAKRAYDDARAAERHAEGETKVLAAAANAAATQLATLSERAAAGERQVRVCLDDLAAARLKADDDMLDRRVAITAQALAETEMAEEETRRALAASDADTARLSLERVERAEQEIRKDIGALEAERRDLQVELRAVGQDGIGERLAELEGELQRERHRLDTMEREAAASRLLHDTLMAAQRDAKERWLGPVRRRVEPYLRLIHPDSEIRIDDRTLEIEGLVRDNRLERFGSLSMGAREQVAVIARLALADVLRAAGQPAAVILDDALVNTDEVRLERMHDVLTLAARSLQILIFTCRERDFIGLGATHRL